VIQITESDVYSTNSLNDWKECVVDALVESMSSNYPTPSPTPTPSPIYHPSPP
jgi:hypothetical protein